MRRLVLASASSRRRDLLRSIGADFEVCVADVDEPAIATGLGAVDAVVTLAEAKAAAARVTHEDLLILGADTMVVGPDGIVGKPRSRAHTVALLKSYRGRFVDVVSGVAFVTGDSSTSSHVRTRVHFGSIDDQTIEEYAESGVADDKAGGLELQGAARPFIAQVEGCWTNVIGLPMCVVSQGLMSHGVISAGVGDSECGGAVCPPFCL